MNAQNYPPWTRGQNNPAANKGFMFQVTDIDNVPDLHRNPLDAKLVLFIGGNQFFVLSQLISGFENIHPELRGHIFYETLPPGVLRKQMANNNTLTLGNFTLTVKPDVYAAGAEAVAELEREGIVDQSTPYATNDLEIMVSARSARAVRSLRDLGDRAIPSIDAESRMGRGRTADFRFTD